MGSGPEALYSQQVCGGSGSFGGDASFTALWKGPSDAAAPPIVSAGMIATHASTPGSKLYDLDPGSGVPRYAETLPSPAIDHFASPSAGGGGLFLASGSSVTAYRIAVPPPGAAPLGEPAGPPLTPAASAPQRRGAGTRDPNDFACGATLRCPARLPTAGREPGQRQRCARPGQDP